MMSKYMYPYARWRSAEIVCRRIRGFILPAGLICIFSLFLSVAHAGEEFSRAIGNSTNRPAPNRLRPPTVPKTLDSLAASAGRDFICIERENFLIASDLEPESAEYLVDGVFDFCRRALINSYFDRLPDPPKTVNLYVFRDYASYVKGLRNFFAMDPISPYGHYGHSQKYLVINYDTGPGTMVHEMTHALMADDFPEAPIWLAEGIASLYEQCRAEGNILKGEDNWRLPELKLALSQGSITPLARLLAMNPSSFRAEKESLHYAQARYFCKYLEDLGLLSGIYKEFRERYTLDPSGARFVAKAFGRSLEAVEGAWKRWITYQHWSEND